MCFVLKFTVYWWYWFSSLYISLFGLLAHTQIYAKSTFAQALETHIPYFRRCNQDSLGKRNRVERLARKCLDEGLSVCIDRTNFDHEWVSLSHLSLSRSFSRLAGERGKKFTCFFGFLSFPRGDHPCVYRTYRSFTNSFFSYFPNS